MAGTFYATVVPMKAESFLALKVKVTEKLKDDDDNFDPYMWLWRRHNDKAERLAAQNPEWAAIQAKRGPRGDIFLNDELRMGDWTRQHEIENELCPEPPYLRVMNHLRPDRHQRANPKWWKRNFMVRWERSKKGWSYRDTWNLDHYLCGVAEGMIRESRQNAHGWPGDPMTFDEWMVILDKMADGFAAVRKLHDADTPEEEAALQAQFDEGFDLFKQWLPALWD